MALSFSDFKTTVPEKKEEVKKLKYLVAYNEINGYEDEDMSLGELTQGWTILNASSLESALRQFSILFGIQCKIKAIGLVCEEY